MVKRQAAAAKSDEPKKKKGKSSKRGRKPTRKKSGSETKHEVVEAEVNGQDQKPKTEPEDFKILPITSELEPLKVCDFSDKDILDIEAPTFSTLPKIGCEALLGLSWNIKAEMIGGKVSCPMIHCCELCNKPILIYGRMIPCKHVFCMTCAVKDRKNCQHCRADVERIDNVRLGSIFMCTEGGRRYGKDGCRRTYMSPRDLQAHIMHRHTANANRPKLKVGMVAGTPQQNSVVSTPGLTPQNHKAPLSIDVHLAQHNQHPHHPLHNAHALHQRSSLSPRPNNMMPHAGNRRLLSPAGGGIPHHHNIPIQRHPSLQQQHHLLQQHHHHHLLSSGAALSKGVRPPRISPGLNLPPPTRTPSADGTPAYSPMPSPSMPSSSSSLIRPPLGSPASMVRSGASNLINVPVYDATGAKQFPPIHRSPMQPHMNIAMAAASNFYATTAPPPFLPSVTPKVEPAAASSPYPQLNLNVPPPNFPLRQTWTQPTATRPEHSSFFSS